MNTTSLVLNGRTAVSIAQLPERQRATLTTLSPSTKARRPAPAKRQLSRDSPGWYNTEDGMTLDDFAKRLNTTLSRIEQFQSRCAQNVVMALMRPTPLVLFVFNPICLIVWVVLLVWWIVGRMTG